MPVYINHIATAVPEIWHSQQYTMNFMKKHLAKDRMTSMILHRLYTNSGIEKRYSVIDEIGEGGGRGIFVDKETDTLLSPPTGVRNEIYTEHARKLFVRAARRIFEDRPEISPDIVTHVITVSCTGFYAPGPDLDIVQALGLPASTQRLHVGFMGCYAAIPALRTANAYVKADPDAVVLVVSAELCTLHLQFDSSTDSLLSGCVFADGCAAALVSSRMDFSNHNEPRKTRPDPADFHHDELVDVQSTSSQKMSDGVTDVKKIEAISNGSKSATDRTKPLLRIDGLFTTVTPNGAEHMAWSIGSNGFDMVLTSYIPDLISSNLNGVLQPIWDQCGLNPDNIDIWAVHPGGKAIVDKVQQQLELHDSQLTASRTVLRDYGNMSSATILFVLKNLMDASVDAENSDNPSVEENQPAVVETASKATSNDGSPKQVLAMAFGPGLTVETMLLTLNPSA